jgi:hypothetical protein
VGGSSIGLLTISPYEVEGVGRTFEGTGVGEGVGAAVGMNGVGVGYQYGTGWPDEPVAPTVVDEPAHPATAATTNNRAPTSFHIPTAVFEWSPNGLRLSGAEGVRCSRGLGGHTLMPLHHGAPSSVARTVRLQ